MDPTKSALETVRSKSLTFVVKPCNLQYISAEFRQLLTLSRIPRLVLIVMHEADTLTNISRNAFNFQSFDISRARVLFEGRYYPGSDEESELLLEPSTPMEQPKVLG